MLKPVEFADFKGLDLRVDPQQVSPAGAVDMLNVELDTRGRVRTRDGIGLLYTAPASINAIWGWKERNRVAVQTGSNIYSVSTLAGTSSGNTATTDALLDAVDFEGVLYLAAGSSGLKKLTEAGAYSAVGGSSPAVAYSVAVQTPDRRIAVADGSGRVNFSDPGDPTTFGANNYVEIAPASSTITLVNWNDLLFAFVVDEIFVFYGNSVDSAGEPIFNYRKVSGEIGVSNARYSTSDPYSIWRAAAVAPDGVYFVNSRGVWRTTGGPPQLVSTPLSPLFDGRSPLYFTPLASNGIGNHPNMPLVAGDRLYYNCNSSDTFVYSLDTQKWEHHAWVLSAAYKWPRAIGIVYEGGTSVPHERPLFFSGTGLYVSGPSYTADAGGAIASSYRSGFFSPGAAGAESHVREWLVDGIGTVDFKTAQNDSATLGAAASLTLGTSPAVAQARDRRAVRGRNFSFQVGASSGAWSVSRVIANVANQRGPGEKSS